ncbi:sigma-70 family RNA polymerase sigma factor [Ekhidna sp.]|uniref:RNA polymerase sigma factor n=1 Tax=Ekhidna sp. TaxID=2608089 RepID=UPI0032985F1B
MKVSFRKSEKEIISDIREGNSKAMEKLYLAHRKEFVSWSIGKFGISEDDALDHYQDTMTIIFEKIMNGSLTEIESSLKTYIFSIGKNKVRQQFDEAARKEKHGDGLQEHYRFLAEDSDAAVIFEEAKNQTSNLFQTIGEGCKEILKLFYYEKKSMSEIADIMGHKSEGVSRTTKKRCLEKIRSQIKKPLANG